VDVGADAELTSSLLGDGELVTSDHLDTDAHVLGGPDRCGGIGTGRVIQGQDADHFPNTLLHGHVTRNTLSNSEGTVSSRGKLVDRSIDLFASSIGIVRHFQDHLGGTLARVEDLTRLRLERGNGAFLDRIERDKVDDLIVLQRKKMFSRQDNKISCICYMQVVQLCLRHRVDYCQVNRLLIVRTTTQGCVHYHVVHGKVAQWLKQKNHFQKKKNSSLKEKSTYAHRILVNRELIESECAGLVGAEDVHASKLFFVFCFLLVIPQLLIIKKCACCLPPQRQSDEKRWHAVSKGAQHQSRA